MQRILRPILMLAILCAALAGLTACGGSDSGGGEKVSSGTDVNTLLDKTFTGSKNVKSGKIDLKLNLNIQGGGSVNGPVNIALSGPFESTGKCKLPKFDVDLSFSGAGQSIKAGAENTGDKAFVNFNGQEYALGSDIYGQFKSGYEQSAGKNCSGTSAGTLGINPRNWLKDAKTAGEGKVGDADVVKITGTVDVPKLLDDVNTALSKAGSLGVSGASSLPTKLTDAQKSEVEKAIKSTSVEIDTGKDDSILRRMLVSFKASDPGSSGGSADVSFDLQLLDLNQGQEFSEPSNTKPFDQLLSQLQSFLPGLAGAGTDSFGSGSSGGSSSGSGSSKQSTENLKKYTDCVTAAGNDVTKAQQCADLLTNG